MNKIHQCKVTDFLDNLDIEFLAKSTNFRKRSPRKITGYNFLLSFFQTMCDREFSLRKWAQKITGITNKLTSFQAISKKLDKRHLAFAKAVFSSSIKQLLLKNKKATSSNEMLLSFNRVLIEDSSCVRMCKALYKYFSGSTNQHTKTAICRIQFCFDLKSNNVERVELNTYSQNDGTYAPKILDRLLPNDLVIRDLGYFVTSVFQGIKDKEAFYISRFKSNLTTYEICTDKEFKLVAHFKKLERSGIKIFDKQLKISLEDKLETRIVGVKLTASQAAKKRKHAKTNRNVISKRAMYLMTWNLYITNVEDEVLAIREVYQLYTLRWQIELIFKNWKSYFKIDKLMSSCRGPNQAKPEMLMYLSLTFWVLIYIPKLKYYRKSILKKYGKHLSPNKFASFMLDNLYKYFIKGESMAKTLQMLVYFCCYDKRKDRINNYEKIYGISP